jgi:uncharacterized protein (DUF2236 family)
VPSVPFADAVRETARRVLSGSADGQPPWVRALAEPGDAGWFGPGSAVWAVHGSVATLVGGVRALLLQAAHPLALAGVLEHSDYAEDPLGRLQRTNRYLTTTTYGSRAQAAAAVRRVRAAHRPVRGRAPDGRPYAADDPHLLLWVHVALVESMLRAAQAYGPRDVDADAYVRESARVARRLGVVDPPTTEQGLVATVQAFRPELAADEATARVLRFLMAPPLPLRVQPAYQVIARAAVDALDPWTVDLLGLPDRPGPLRALDAAACRALLGVLREVLGPTSPGERAATARAGRSGATSVEPDRPVGGHDVDGDDAAVVAVDPVDVDGVERMGRGLT